MKLSPLEKKILKAIQEHYSISWDDVESVHFSMGSFDDTIMVFKYAKEYGINCFSVICILKNH